VSVPRMDRICVFSEEVIARRALTERSAPKRSREREASACSMVPRKVSMRRRPVRPMLKFSMNTRLMRACARSSRHANRITITAGVRSDKVTNLSLCQT